MINSDPTAFLKSIALGIPAIVIVLGFRGYILCGVAGTLGERQLRWRNLSTNPITYLDAIGSLCCLFYNFGWSVRFNYDRRSFRNPRLDEFLLWFSGSLYNILCGIFVFGLAMLFPPHSLAVEFLFTIMQMSFVSGVFALLPLYPLPGYSILDSFLNFRQRLALDKYRSLMMFIGIFCLFVWGHRLSLLAFYSMKLISHFPVYVLLGLPILLALGYSLAFRLYASKETVA